MLQRWAGLVTAVLEYLPPDASIVECFALMSISFNDQWRAQALAQLDRDPLVLDRLLAAIPWDDVVESLVDADRKDRSENETTERVSDKVLPDIGSSHADLHPT